MPLFSYECLAHGKFDKIENDYKKQSVIKVTFRGKDSNVLSEKIIPIEPLICMDQQPMSNDYMGDPGIWIDFNFAVKRPLDNSGIQVLIYNRGHNKTLISNLVIENVAVK